jgi:hypothetical protein
MRANISDLWFNKMEEKIYVDLELHILNNKLTKSKENKQSKLVKQMENLIKQKNNEKRDLNQFLRDNKIKIEKAIRVDDMFVRYHYYCKVEAGYKEGYLQFWDSAMKYKLKKRLNKYFT